MKILNPINDQVVLKKLEQGEQRINGIILPDMGQEKPILAEVVSRSKGIYNWQQNIWKAHEVAVGDIVVLPKLGAQVVTLEGTDYYVCQAQQLLARVIDCECGEECKCNK